MALIEALVIIQMPWVATTEQQNPLSTFIAHAGKLQDAKHCWMCYKKEIVSSMDF